MAQQRKRNRKTTPKQSRDRGRLLTVLAAAAIILGGAWWGWQQWQQPASVSYSAPEAIQAGATLYADNCATCHGPQAGGESAQNPQGGEKPGGGYWAPALNGSAHAWHHSPDALFRTVKNGSPAPGSTMAGFDGRLTDREIHQVLAYVRSLWPPPVQQRYRQAFLQ